MCWWQESLQSPFHCFLHLLYAHFSNLASYKIVNTWIVCVPIHRAKITYAQISRVNILINIDHILESVFGDCSPILPLTLPCISWLSIMTGRLESSHLDRCVSDRCDVCGPDGGDNSGSSPSWGHRWGVEESPGWESNLWPGVRALYVCFCNCIALYM